MQSLIGVNGGHSLLVAKTESSAASGDSDPYPGVATILGFTRKSRIGVSINVVAVQGLISNEIRIGKSY